MIDTLITSFDKGLRTLFAPAQSRRAHPDVHQPDVELTQAEKKHAAGLMRVNHTGEVCAQALYLGQALTSRNPDTTQALRAAAEEETEHLAWCEHRLQQLGSQTSVFNPLFFAGSLGIGMLAGAVGDRWNLGFLAETERQVGAHLESHLGELPTADLKSRAVVKQMQIDEAQHASMAIAHGAAELPPPVKTMMRLASKVMTHSTYRI